MLLLITYMYKINDKFQKRVRRMGDLEAQESSTWILAGATTFGLLSRAVFGSTLGMVPAIVGASVFFPMGGVLGSVAGARLCMRHDKARAQAQKRAAGLAKMVKQQRPAVSSQNTT
eukprot:921377-Prymnesium_polylepis.2